MFVQLRLLSIVRSDDRGGTTVSLAFFGYAAHDAFIFCRACTENLIFGERRRDEK